ncbi:MAG: VWA domain-containing protein [Planctomycetes bacterium]|nr:VWA domain-containing protein [Planctomycetota bacterium]
MLRTPKLWATTMGGLALITGIVLTPLFATDETPTPAPPPAATEREPAKLGPGILSTEPTARPRVDVCFVLDTTGSMGGLIEGAKQKIWTIANAIAKGQPRPDVRIGLIAYRDRGDDYVTRTFELSDDIDAVFKNLMSFGAAGGGDGPEHVNQALQDAITKMTWDRARATLRLCFLVGDAPPHMDYGDNLDYHAIAKNAIEQDIVINTVRCGGDAETERVWQEIARLAEGTYTSIAQNGGVTAVTTPLDEEMAALNAKLADTVVAYGARDKQRASDEKREAAKGLAPAAAAERAEFMGGKDGGLDESDLVEAAQSGRAQVQALKQEELPEAMRGMSDAEKSAFIEKKAAERETIRKQIAEVASKRTAWLAEQLKGAKGDSFDASVLRAIRGQAAKKGIRYAE